MSAVSGITNDSPPPSQSSALRNPLAVVVLGFALLTASIGAFGIGARLSRHDSGDDAGNRLAAGSLALVHARMEHEAAVAFALTSNNAELLALKEEVQALQKKLDDLALKAKAEESRLAALTTQKTDAASRRQAFQTEKKRLEAMSAAFVAARKTRTTAEEAMRSAMGMQAATVTADDFDAWKKEWERVSKDAIDKISTAKSLLTSLQAKGEEWKRGKDSFTPDEAKSVQQGLRSLHVETSKRLVDARNAASQAEKELSTLLINHRQQLDKAAASLVP